MSTFVPMRKPSRMPFFTHKFTRQPVGLAASGSAARTRPSLSAVWNVAKISKCAGVYSAGLVSKSSSMSVCMMNEEADGFENFLDLSEIRGRRRNHRQAVQRTQEHTSEI